ncbi:MAG TPA: chloride channel protein [bacterium]|nr:chloride channel protein [bacterium]
MPRKPKSRPIVPPIPEKEKIGILSSRTVILTSFSIAIALVVGIVAQGLIHLIALITNISFYHRFSFEAASPANHTLGLLVILVPVIGGLIVGFMAFWGHQAIRGHGIPEAMEVILTKESRIHPSLIWLKPLSAAISIGTGGPFGAEGPIIATGGAVGSFVGQWVHFTPEERKVLLAAGAAAGMAATFGVSVSAAILAVELLLFEFHPRSLIPVSFASVTAQALRNSIVGSAPMFPMADITAPSGRALVFYGLVGAAAGVASVWITKAVYAVEDNFDHLPIHWKWWPALGGIAVGVCGLVAPLTLGVGYDNIQHLVSGDFPLRVIMSLTFFKFISWCLSLGSGTSGGTLAPLFTIGGGLGALLTVGLAWVYPLAGLDPRIGALVGMAALFGGASRAFLASVIFAFELCHQPLGLLPLFIGCAASYLVSCLMMRNTIMTEKIVRRGVGVPDGYLGHPN